MFVTGNSRSLTTSIPPLLLILLVHFSSIGLVHPLKCYCNTCPNNNSYCETSEHKESQCYMSVEKVRPYTIDGQTYDNDTSYGCISGGDDLLGPLQCYANTNRFQNVVYIRCCNNEDECNVDLPDPTVKDDPRWAEPDTKYLNILFDTWRPIFFCLLGLLLSFILLKLYLMFAKCSRSTKDSRGSTCSLKADLDRFHHNFTSSSASTHSYSISESCRKTPVPVTEEDSFIPEDLTSGIGERMLNQRTIARAIGSGKTDQVGSGRFGRVFRGQYHGEDVAVKAFKAFDSESWAREDQILRLLSHDNIVRYIASETTSINNTSEQWMFLEYCPFGSLCDYLDHNEVMGPQQAIRILYSIINGLNYLHEDYAQFSLNQKYKPSIAHRDIKTKNILMKTPDCCCIADFGHALIKRNEESLDYGNYQHLQVGTIRYMAPEILRPNNNLNYRHFSTFAQADLYQYGLILWEVCHRTALDVLHPAGEHKLPYDGVVPQNPSMLDMIKIVCEDQYRPPKFDKWEKYPQMKRLSELMVECWRPNPKARMETLGVKKKLKEMYERITPLHTQQYQLNLYNNFSLYSSSRSEREKTRSDLTM